MPQCHQAQQLGSLREGQGFLATSPLPAPILEQQYSSLTVKRIGLRCAQLALKHREMVCKARGGHFLAVASRGEVYISKGKQVARKLCHRQLLFHVFRGSGVPYTERVVKAKDTFGRGHAKCLFTESLRKRRMLTGFHAVSSGYLCFLLGSGEGYSCSPIIATRFSFTSYNILHTVNINHYLSVIVNTQHMLRAKLFHYCDEQK